MPSVNVPVAYFPRFWKICPTGTTFKLSEWPGASSQCVNEHIHCMSLVPLDIKNVYDNRVQSTRAKQCNIFTGMAIWKASSMVRPVQAQPVRCSAFTRNTRSAVVCYCTEYLRTGATKYGCITILSRCVNSTFAIWKSYSYAWLYPHCTATFTWQILRLLFSWFLMFRR